MASKFALQVEDAKESLEDLLRACRSEKAFQSVVEYLLTIYRKVQKHSTKNYDIRRLMKSDPGFRETVWRWSAARDFLEASGWVEVSESLILPSYVDLTKACALLEKTLKRRVSTSSRSSTSSGSRESLASTASRSKKSDVSTSKPSASTRRPSACSRPSSTSSRRSSTNSRPSSTSTRRSSARASAGG